MYLRIKEASAGDSLTKDGVFDTLRGKKGDATLLKIIAAVVCPGTNGDLPYVKRNFADLPKFMLSEYDSRGSPWPRHWQVAFSFDDVDVYARQLGFFGIELGVLQPDNKIIYAYNLNKPRPDSRVVSNPAVNENRYYLTWRNGEMQQADRELLARAGIDPGERLALKFLPREIERQLAILERNYRNATPREIARTRFGVRAEGKGFAFYVVEQVLKENEGHTSTDK